MKRNWKRVCALYIALAMCMSTLNLTVVAEENATASTETTVSNGDSLRERYVLPFSVQREELKVSFQTINQWEGGYQAEIVLQNEGDVPIEDWQIDFSSGDTITNIWNAALAQKEENTFYITAQEYNSVINAGESVTIGYCAEGAACDIVNLEVKYATVDDGDENTDIALETYRYVYDTYTVEYSIKNIWEENCNVSVTIMNTSDVNMENWKITWQSEDIISNVYNAQMTCEEGMYSFKNVAYNQDILAGGQVEFGFDVRYGASFDMPKGFAMGFAETEISSDSYVFESVITNAWDSGYTGEILITNVGDMVIEDWYLTLQCEDSITNIWIGTLEDLGNGMYGIKNPAHHQNLQPGETIVIGYQAQGTKQEPMIPLMLGASEESVADSIPETPATTEVPTTTEAPAETEAPSATEVPIETQPPTATATATPVPTETPIPTTTPVATEAPFEGNYIQITTVFDEFMEGVYEVSEKLDCFEGVVNNRTSVQKVTYEVWDAFGNMVDADELIFGENSGTWGIYDLGLVIGWNDIIFTVHLTDDAIVEETYSYVNSAYENMERADVGIQDSDEDGIIDYYEAVYGTDKDNPDTDGDDLSDFQEMMSTGTDPTLYDTDENGIWDSQEDFDGDGLNTLEEMIYGTSPWYNDSDFDDIDDKTEITVTGTDSMDEDTDDDDLTDGEELKLGTNPLLKDTDGDGVNDDEEKIEQQTALEIEDETGAVQGVSVSLSCSGDIENQVFIRNTIEEDALSAGVVGLVGVPVEINSMAPFDEAVITFQYDREKLGDAKEENLCVMWYDEENLTYVLLEDSVLDTVNQTVSYTTTHFSTYLLVDKEIWLDAWRMEINYDEYVPDENDTTYDILICVDYSVTEEELALENQFVEKLAEQMIEGDRVRFGVYTPNGAKSYYYTDWITTKEGVLSAIQNAKADVYSQYKVDIGPTGTYRAENYQAIYMMLDMIDINSENETIGFLVNAGKNEENAPAISMNSESSARSDLATLGCPVHSVSVTSNVNEKLEALLKEYGGESFKLITLQDRVEYLIRGYGFDVDGYDMLDSDEDGLYDTFEVNGMRIQNGTVVYTDPYLADSDGDGINDFKEIGGLPGEFFYANKNNKFVSTINYQKSDPNDVNSIGKSQLVGYMEVDDFDYLPYNKSTYDDIFLNSTGKKDTNGNTIYGLYNIYNSNPSELTDEEVDQIRKNVINQCFWTQVVMERPTTFLMKYITNYEDRNFYSSNGVMKDNISVRNAWGEDVFHLMIAAEGYVGKNETVILAQTSENQNSGVQIVPIKKNNDGKLETNTVNDFLSIHFANTRVVGKVTYDGTKYVMNLKYYLLDYYDWDEEQDARLGLVTDSQLYKLCRCGKARFYENWGICESTITWEATEESRQAALRISKDLMEFGIFN